MFTIMFPILDLPLTLILSVFLCKDLCNWKRMAKLNLERRALLHYCNKKKKFVSHHSRVEGSVTSWATQVKSKWLNV